MRFVDTNVLLYAVSKDPAEAPKAEVARALLDGTDLALSVQVLQEFYVQATRATRTDRLSHDQASALVEAFTRFSVQDVTLGIVRAALATRNRFNLSYWDGAIIEAARTIGCTEILSEDLSDGQDYDGVIVVNPFGARPQRDDGLPSEP
ncbi:MAG: PIN domain-containing protein [Micropruina sp.]|nr:PIN domain-containing protein [Micropruina sp.]